MSVIRELNIRVDDFDFIISRKSRTKKWDCSQIWSDLDVKKLNNKSLPVLALSVLTKKERQMKNRIRARRFQEHLLMNAPNVMDDGSVVIDEIPIRSACGQDLKKQNLLWTILKHFSAKIITT